MREEGGIDVKEVARMARRIVLDWGMGQTLGPLALNLDGSGARGFLGPELSWERAYSEETGALVDAEIRRIVEEAYGRAQEALRTHEPALHRLAAALLEHEVVEREQIAEIIAATPATQALATTSTTPEGTAAAAAEATGQGAAVPVT